MTTSTRYQVIRYPTYYVVVDMAAAEHKIVFESRERSKCRAIGEDLNKDDTAARKATQS